MVSTALAASTTAAPGASDRNRRWPPAVDFDRVHCSAGGVQLDNVRERHQEQTPGGIIATRGAGVVADGVHQDGKAAVLVEAEEPGHRWTSLHRERSRLDAVRPNR